MSKGKKAKPQKRKAGKPKSNGENRSITTPTAREVRVLFMAALLLQFMPLNVLPCLFLPWLGMLRAVEHLCRLIVDLSV